MPATTTTRPLSDAERQELQRILTAIPGRLGMAKMGLASALLLWAASLIGALLLWLIVAAVARAALQLSIGLDSPHRTIIVTCLAIVCACYAALNTSRWARSQTNLAPEIQRDLANGTALEETYRFTDVKRLQEPEHDGLLYFLKSSTGQTYVMFDSESQDLGAGGDDAMRSSFAPSAQLRVVRAPLSRLVLSNAFTGQPFELPAPSELFAPPAEWPEQDEYCAVAWDEIQSRYGRPISSA